ncbi:hypothetical protein AAG570_008425 [Ranatra chinensis]|uniref:Uncharacterized protein n=1 Tax=Ranatra chinensis TaxID=642074 RepID=A0ABD0YQW8_9HEMI
MATCRISSSISRFRSLPLTLGCRRNLFLPSHSFSKNNNLINANLETLPLVFNRQCPVSSQNLCNKNERLHLLSAHKRNIHVSGSNLSRKDASNERELPKLLYVQNPLVWFSNKLDFRFLRKNWDPHFSEAEFSRGARKAVSVITELVSLNMFDGLKSLLTKNALLSLRRDIELVWDDGMRRNIALKPEHVQLVITRKLYFRNKASHKSCDIDLVFIGLRWMDNIYMENPPLLFVDIFGRFHRNYTEGIKPEWTVSAFRVRRFNLLQSRNKS